MTGKFYMIFKVIFLFVIICESWVPFDALEKEILHASLEANLARLDDAIDATSNPVLANLTRTWGPLCMNGRANVVLARPWPKNTPSKIQGGVVPWSLAVDSLRYEKEIRKYSDGDVRKKCMTTSHELLRSIHDGERVCSLHLLDAQSICEILNRYSHIVWFGNSITTQTIIGLLNLLASNLSTNTKYTYNPIFPHLNSRAEEGQQRCRCDGQYSPHTTCKRSYRELDLVNSIEKVCWDIMDESFHASSFRFKFMKVFNGVQNDLRFRSCENQDDARPHLIYVQAGNQDVAFSDTNPRHVQHDLNPREIDVAAFCQRILTPVILEYEYYFQHCNNGKTFPVHIVFSGVHARNHHPNGINETTYSLTALKALNDRLLDYVKKWYPHVHVLDFFMLTLPPTGSPDGYHYYTSTNIQKANVLVQLMAILADQ